MDSSAIAFTLNSLAHSILADKPLFNSTLPLAIVGIRSRGELLAQRLAASLSKILPGNPTLDIGALDITMYRDDLASRHSITIPRGTDMNFRLDDRPLLLVDDVLDTGRSVRAALDALVDFGRPSIIRLVVLIDRTRREFPVAADYIGLTVNAPDPSQKVIVHLIPTDSEDAVYLQ